MIRLQRHAHLALTFLALACFSGSVGTLAPPSQRLFGFIAVALMVVLGGAGRGLRAALLVLGAAWWLATLVDEPALWIVAAAAVVAMLPADSGNASPRFLPAGMILFAIVTLIVHHSPDAWRAVGDTSVSLSSALTNDVLTLGAGASGIWLLIACLCLCAAASAGASRLSDAGLAVVAGVAGIVAYLFHLAIAAPYWPAMIQPVLALIEPPQPLTQSNWNAAWIELHLSVLLLGLLLVPALVLLPRAEQRPWRTSGRPWLAAIAVLGFATAASTATFHPTSPAAGARVLLYNQGMLDWRVPRYGLYGLQRAGMFGLFPRYLEAAGYETTRMRSRAAITRELLADANVLIVINPTEPFDSRELEAVWAFVERGGGLLVLGDHTDLGGIMAPLNRLLGPVGIRYRFDSAFSIRHWVGDVEIFPHPITRLLDGSNERLQQSTGASLELGKDAYPLVNGKFAFSDAGVRENEANAFLGDYLWQFNERLGDVVVIAGADYGRGRVIAFGDTSAFQNVAIVHSAPFIVQVMDFLSEPSAAPPGGFGDTMFGWTGPVVAVALMLSFGVVVTWRRERAAMLVGALSLCVSTAVLDRLGEPAFRFTDDRLVFIEADRLNRFSLASWQRDSVGGLANSLHRAGYLPLILRRPEQRAALERAAMLISIAPGREYRERDRERVLEFVRSGGVLVIAAGWEERHAIEALLADIGLTLDPRPLGPVPVLRKTADPALIRAMQAEPHFQEAWGIAGERALEEVLYEGFGLPVAGIRQFGEGRVVVIADSYFLLDRSLEEENAWWPGNVRFMRSLLYQLVP